eukprot:Clim_evm11s212 gene=Clim_evmTU11s212
MSSTKVTRRATGFTGDRFEPTAMKKQVKRRVKRNSKKSVQFSNWLNDIVLGLASVVAAILATIMAALMKIRSETIQYLFGQRKDYANYKTPPYWLQYWLSRWAFSVLHPVVYGLENIPADKPVMLVCNHATMIADVPTSQAVFRRVSVENGRHLMSLADFFWWSSWPVNRLVEYWGGFLGTRANVTEVMKHGHNILIYPGGADEAMKSKDIPKYELIWKKRKGFVDMAALGEYTIIPVAVVGGEEYFDIWFDIWGGWFFYLTDPNKAAKRSGFTVPVLKPWTQRPMNLYIKFGKAIDTSYLKGQTPDDEIWKLREECRETLASDIKEMREHQSKDEGTPLYDPTDLDNMIKAARAVNLKKAEERRALESKLESKQKAIAASGIEESHTATISAAAGGN